MNDDLHDPAARSGSSRSAADLLRAAVDHISAMVAYWDSSLRCRFANRAYERWFGVSPEALIGRHLREFLGEALYEANRPYIEGALRGEPQEFERTLSDPAGGPPRSSLAQYIPDVVGGEVRGFFVLVSDVSAVKRAEESLRASEARFSGIVSISADAIISIDEQHRIVVFNEGAEHAFGWSREEVLGERVERLVPPRHREGLTRYLDGLSARDVRVERFAGGEDELCGVRKHGEEFPAEATVSKLVLGSRTLLTMSLRDIGERKRVERETRRLADQREELLTRTEAANAQLREAEERFRLTIDEAPIGMAIVALDGRFMRVNRALCEIVGYAPDELTGLTFQAITHPEDLDGDLALLEQLVAGETARYQVDKRYVRKDGAVVDIALSVSVLRGVDGKPVHFISQIEDVTARKRAELGQRLLAEVGSTLAASLDYEQTLTTLAETAVRSFADMCFVDVVEDDQVRRVKVAARDPSRRELCERFMAIPPDPPRRNLLRTVLDTRKSLLIPRPTDEAIAAFARSEEHLVLLRAADMRSIIAVPLLAHGQVLGALGFVSSTPARIYDDLDLRLAEEVAQRAARAIENARLYRTARRATQARDDVLGIVAHDLRSPLGVILMQAQALRRQEALAAREPASGERSRTPADVIERAAKRMNRLIQDLLDVTRIEAKRLRIEPSPLSAERLVGDLVEAHRPVASSASLELCAELAPDLPDVWADRDRLVQVFENLVGNALKFTPAGGRITIGAVRRSGEVMFWVRDTGSGIAVDDVPHVFDCFWQADKGGFRRGAGLGLPIVKGIVEAHHGLIWLESTPGRGSTFFFTIPTAKRALASRPERAASPAR